MVVSGMRVSRGCAASFRVPAHRITFINSPTDFLSELSVRAAAARRRIALSSLYLGGDSLSASLIQACQTALDRRETLASAPSVRLVLDGSRAVRGAPSSSSVAAAEPLLERGANLHLWQRPSGPAWRRGGGGRLSELLGVWHAKVHVLDDAVILTGANLSESYFRDRCDRYVLIEDARVADYFAALLELTSSFAPSVVAGGRGLRPPSRRLEADAFRRDVEALAADPRFAATTGDSEEETVLVEPAVQLGAFGLCGDEKATREFLQAAEPGDALCLASA